jgi:hypothetical protein
MKEKCKRKRSNMEAIWKRYGREMEEKWKILMGIESIFRVKKGR